MMSAKLWAPALTACALATSLVLVGCSKDPKEGQPAAAQQMPPPEVGIIAAQPTNVAQTVELSGRTAAYQMSEVRPQVSGIVLKRLFTEGSYVRAGQALYEIDPRTYKATSDNAQAAVQRAEANLNVLKVKEGRYRQLVNSNAISKQEYDDIVAQVRLAEADLNSAKANYQNAQINLGYSVIRAPISGQTGRSTVTAGALVTASQADALVTIQQLDPIYVDINQSSTELVRLRQNLSKGNLTNANNTTVKLKLEDGSYYPIEGKLAFSDASVDQETGSVTLRAVFSNPNHLLLPGMYATAQIVQAEIPNAYLIPQAALTRTPTGQAVAMLVNGKNAVEARPVVTSGSQGTNWIVTQGLNAGERVIVDGVAKVKEGAPVVPKVIDPNASSAPNAPAAAPEAESKAPAAEDKTASKA